MIFDSTEEPKSHKTMAEDNDQVVADIIKDDDQPDNKPSEGTDKEPTIRELAQTIKGLQKGYTINRQEMAQINANLQAVADSINDKTGADKGEEEYVTVSKLRETLAEYDEQKATQAQERMRQAETALEEQMEEVITEGIISEGEKQSLWTYAASIKEVDLFKAAAKFNKLSQEKKDTLTAKKQDRQDAGSKVGSSSKAGAGKPVVDWGKIHNTSWENL